MVANNLDPKSWMTSLAAHYEAMSGYVAAADADRLGFDDFLAKPISFTKLESHVREKLKMT